MFGALKTTRGILERGLDGTISEPLRSEHSTPYLFYLISLLNVHESGPGDLQFFELCADHGLDDVLDHTETILVLLRNGVSFSAFHAFLKRNGFCYDSLPIETRLQHLRELSESDRSWNPDEVKQIIPEIFELTAEIIELSLDEGCALIHSVALLFSRRLTTWISPLGGDQRLEEEKKQWSKLIGSCIRQDPASLHRLESVCSRNNGYSEASPFSFILWSFFGTKHYSYLSLDSERHVMPPMQLLLESALTAWITTLSNCGIDLLSYGRQEKRLYDEGSTRYRRQFIPWDYSSVTSRLLLIGFTYGSRPEQWKLWWTWEYEDYAGEFWDLVESQRFKMPGSWVDEPWDCDDFVLEERRRQDIWEMEQNTPLIWSEYRKIRPPS
ncbi:hypothetical protein LX32DRAFT_130689 [Colletotrichum zoysiae]|uniref:Uncharacterized protein n=1 Tax=Colletotrichum zoysiae TaxID=1216348 RepID=A0AAD9LZJ4_9PEZI|nr:hypothetical protein LX32DRAFT_130689 [Colletotrichum zoysiae]